MFLFADELGILLAVEYESYCVFELVDGLDCDYLVEGDVLGA